MDMDDVFAPNAADAEPEHVEQDPAQQGRAKAMSIGDLYGLRQIYKARPATGKICGADYAKATAKGILGRTFARARAQDISK